MIKKHLNILDLRIPIFVTLQIIILCDFIILEDTGFFKSHILENRKIYLKFEYMNLLEFRFKNEWPP